MTAAVITARYSTTVVESEFARNNIDISSVHPLCSRLCQPQVLPESLSSCTVQVRRTDRVRVITTVAAAVEAVE